MYDGIRFFKLVGNIKKPQQTTTARTHINNKKTISSFS